MPSAPTPEPAPLSSIGSPEAPADIPESMPHPELRGEQTIVVSWGLLGKFNVRLLSDINLTTDDTQYSLEVSKDERCCLFLRVLSGPAGTSPVQIFNETGSSERNLRLPASVDSETFLTEGLNVVAELLEVSESPRGLIAAHLQRKNRPGWLRRLRRGGA